MPTVEEQLVDVYHLIDQLHEITVRLHDAVDSAAGNIKTEGANRDRRADD